MRGVPVLASLLALLLAAPHGQADELPASFEDDLVRLIPRLEDGRSMTFYTDTGGGWNAISEDAVARLALPQAAPLEGESGPVATVEFPSFAAGAAIPLPPADNWMEGRLIVAPGGSIAVAEDAFLGGRYFGGGVWDFDYGTATLARLDEPAPWPGARETTLGFQLDSTGRRTTQFPRIAVTVDGESIDMLLDTGAKATLTEAAGDVLGRPAGTPVGTSFVVQEIFNRWRAAHPDWLVIEAGDALRNATFPMIRVPTVTVAGVEVGPVWFTLRPDHNFDDYLSRFMDQPVRGAIGGSALRHYRMQIDYPGGRAYFGPARPGR